MLSSETLHILGVTVIGAILLWGLVYRVKTFGTPKFYRAVTANAAVFSAFALGIIYLEVTHTSVLGTDLTVSMQGLFHILSAPVAYLGWCLWRKRPLSPFKNKVALVAVAWVALWMAFAGTNIVTYVYFTSLFFFLFSLGVINAIAGPIIVSIAAVKIVISLMAGHYNYQAIQDFLVDNGLPMIPGPLGVIAGLVITAMGIGEFVRYFGANGLLDKITETVQG